MIQTLRPASLGLTVLVFCLLMIQGCSKSRPPAVARVEPLDRRVMLAAQAYDWSSVAIKGNGFIDGIVYSPAAPNVAYIHTDMGGAYRWDQGASKWQPMNDWSRWDDWAPQNMGVETMAVHPTDPNKVWMV